MNYGENLNMEEDNNSHELVNTQENEKGDEGRERHEIVNDIDNDTKKIETETTFVEIKPESDCAAKIVYENETGKGNTIIENNDENTENPCAPETNWKDIPGREAIVKEGKALVDKSMTHESAIGQPPLSAESNKRMKRQTSIQSIICRPNSVAPLESHKQLSRSCTARNIDLKSDTSDAEQKNPNGVIDTTKTRIPPKQINDIPTIKFATYKFQRDAKYVASHSLWTTDLRLVHNIPPPKHPQTRRASICDGIPFQKIDSKSVKVSQNLYRRPLYELVEYLTSEYDSDIERLRSIYSWLIGITLQLDKIKFPIKASTKGTAFDFLRKFKRKMTNHAELFANMCRDIFTLNIPCVIIHGFQKGSRYNLEEPVAKLDNYGEWNTVLVDHEWRFVNTFWGSGVTENINAIDSFFFMTDPEHLMYTHFPSEPEWQLLQTPISLDEFDSNVFLKERFFELEMQVKSHTHFQILVENGEKEIQFHVNRNIGKFHHMICVLHKRCDGGYEPLPLKSNGTRNMIYFPSPDILAIKLRFPKKGLYKLEIVGKDKRCTASEYDFNYIAIYCACVMSVGSSPRLFPVCGDSGWGNIAEELGLVTDFPSTLYTTKESPIKIQYKYTNTGKPSKESVRSIMFKMVTLDILLEDSEPTPATFDEENQTFVCLLHLMPHQETGICVFAELDSAKREPILRNISNYLVYFDKQVTPPPSPPPPPPPAMPAPSEFPTPSPIPEAIPEPTQSERQMKDIVQQEIKRIEAEDGDDEQPTAMHWTKKFLATSKSKQKGLRHKQSAFKLLVDTVLTKKK